jgi:hypothetical protein
MGKVLKDTTLLARLVTWSLLFNFTMKISNRSQLTRKDNELTCTPKSDSTSVNIFSYLFYCSRAYSFLLSHLKMRLS